MRVLVTGSAGFIGGWVGRELEAQGHEMVPFDHPDTIRSVDRLRDAMGDVGAVINLAGVLGTAEMIGGEVRAAKVNILGALNVFDVAAREGAPVVQIATGHRGQLNPYAITKACAEDLALSRAQWLGERIAVVRAFHVYGPGQKAPPPHGTATVRKIVPSFVCRALTGMPLEINGHGQQMVDLVYVADVAKVLVDALGGPYGEVVDAGTGIGTTVVVAARDVIRLCSSTSSTLHLPMRPGEPSWSVVVAENPSVVNVWPYGMTDTIGYYQDQLAAVPA